MTCAVWRLAEDPLTPCPDHALLSAPQMLRYILTERPGDRAAAGEAGLLPRLATLLRGSDPDVVEAALGVASVYAQPPEQVHYLRQVR